jgi:hypothetical protein
MLHVQPTKKNNEITWQQQQDNIAHIQNASFYDQSPNCLWDFVSFSCHTSLTTFLPVRRYRCRPSAAAKAPRIKASVETNLMIFILQGMNEWSDRETFFRQVPVISRNFFGTLRRVQILDYWPNWFSTHKNRFERTSVCRS